MIRGALSHLDLTITDPDRAVPFYDAVLPLLGYRRVPVEPGTTAVACWSIADGDTECLFYRPRTCQGRWEAAEI